MDIGCVHIRANRDLDPRCLLVDVDFVQSQTAQIVYLRPVNQAADRRLIGRRSRTRLAPTNRRNTEDSYKGSCTPGAQRFDHYCTKYDLQSPRAATRLLLYGVRTNLRKQPRPGNRKPHLIRRQFAQALPVVLLMPRLTRKSPLPHRSSPSTLSLFNQPRDAELAQRLPKLLLQARMSAMELSHAQAAVCVLKTLSFTARLSRTHRVKVLLALLSKPGLVHGMFMELQHNC